MVFVQNIHIESNFKLTKGNIRNAEKFPIFNKI